MKTPRERCIEKQLEAQADTISELEDKLWLSDRLAGRPADRKSDPEQEKTGLLHEFLTELLDRVLELEEQVHMLERRQDTLEQEQTP